MLSFLGLPMRAHPHTVATLRDKVQELATLWPEKTVRGYDLIVLGKDPATMPAVDPIKVETMDKEHAYSIISEMWRNESRAAVDSVADKTAKLIENMQHSSLKVAHDAIAEEAKKFRRIEIAKRGVKATKKMDGVLPKEFDRLVQLANQRKNILMVGPAGCGKTYVAGKIAEALNLDYASQSCSEGISESVFTGWLLPTGAGGRFEHTASQFVERYEKGGVFLFDEFDATDPNVGVFLNQALANDHFFLPQRSKKPIVQKHRDFVAVAAANTFGMGADTTYVGRTQLDAATLDRFKVGTVQMGYDEQVEKHLIESRCPEVYEWGLHVRAKIAQHKLRKIMSTRVMIDAADMMLEEQWTLSKVKEAYFSDWSREERAIGNR